MSKKAVTTTKVLTKAQPTKTNELALVKVADTMLISKEAITDAVKASTTDDLHRVSKLVKSFVTVFEPVAKEEVKNRIQAAGTKSIETAEGKIQLISRANVTVDEEKIRKILIANNIDPTICFTPDYIVITKDVELLETLETNGAIMKSFKFDYDSMKSNVLDNPGISDDIKKACSAYIATSTTEYLRGF